jgi:hypothetical protein
LEARPVGNYDDSEHPWDFVRLKGEYRIREQNARRNWYNIDFRPTQQFQYDLVLVEELVTTYVADS